PPPSADRPVTHVLPTQDAVAELLRRLTVEDGDQAHSGGVLDSDAVATPVFALSQVGADERDDRRGDVEEVHVQMALTRPLEPSWPRDDERVTDPAFTDTDLVLGERGVRDRAPVRPVRLDDVRAAGHHAFDVSVLNTLGRRAYGPAFARAAVVGGEDDDRVVALALALQLVEYAPDTGVHRLDLRGVDSHPFGLPRLVAGFFPAVQVPPCRQLDRPWEQADLVLLESTPTLRGPPTAPVPAPILRHDR